MVSFFGPDETVLVADGGLATELEARGNDLSDALWSARLLMDAPGQIMDAHLAFFRAGAQIATSASYQASFEGFACRGLGPPRGGRADAAQCGPGAGGARPSWPGTGGRGGWPPRSGRTARRWRTGRSTGAATGAACGSWRAWHRPRLEVLAEAGPDVLALETVPDTDEAEALMAAIAGLGIPAWLSYSIAGGRTRAGQSLAEAFAVAAGVPEVVAVGVNCCAPADVLRGHRCRPGGDGQAGDRVSQQRRGLGRPAARLDGAVPATPPRSRGSG